MGVKLKVRKLKDKCTSYYLDINFEGVRSYEWLGIKLDPKRDTPEKKREKITLANFQRSQREIELASLGTNYIPKHKKKVDFIAYYENYLESYTKKDVRMIKYSFEKFKLFLDRKLLFSSDVTEALCEEFKDYLQNPKNGLTGETPQNYFNRFRKVIRAATKSGILASNPTQDIRFKNSDDSNKLKKEVLDKVELQKLAETKCDREEVKKCFLFACFTGLGIAEIRTLKWSNLNNDRLKINRIKTKTEINIPLSKTAKQIVGKRGESNEFVFDINISDPTIAKHLKRWVKRAKLDKNISFYCGRHVYAVLLLTNGANLKTVSDCMGHVNTKHTIKYLNYVDSLKDKAMESMPIIEL